MKKILACVLALTMLCGVALAGNADDYLTDGVVVGYGEEEDGTANGYLNANGFAITDAYGVTFTVELSADEIANEETWIGGGLGVNSTSTGWYAVEWGKASGEKPIAIEDGLDGTTCTLTWLSDSPIFTADDTWCQFWIQCWGGTMTVVGCDILGADGNPLGATVDTSTDATTDATTDAQPSTGDATSIVLLAGVAVMAMVGVVASKKRA